MRDQRHFPVILAALLVMAAFSLACFGCKAKEADSDIFTLLAAERESRKAVADYDPVVINLVHSSSERSAVNRVANMFKTMLEEESKGEILVEIYPNDSLGYVYDYNRALREGTVDAWIGSGGIRLNTVLYWLPTITGASLDKIQAFVQSDAYRKESQKLCAEAGYKALAIFPVQYRALTSNKPIRTMDDFPEIRMRSYLGGSNEAVYWNALGASTESYDIHELYRALEEGLVDGQSNTLPLIVSNRLYEQQDYLVDLRHMVYYDGLFMGTEFYDRLTDEQRAVVDDVAIKIGDYAKDMYKAEADRCAIVLEKSGMQFLPISDEFREEIRVKAAPDLEAALRERVGDEYVDFVINAMKG